MHLSSMSLQQIKQMITGTDTVSEEFLQLMASDERTGVRQLYQKYLRQITLEKKEMNRLQALELYELDLRNKGFKMIAGVDEAGRGPLAGPVVAAAAVLPQGLRLKGLNDSKKVTPIRREQLYEEIMREAITFSVSIVSVEEIDTINIYQASLKAMWQAVEGLSKAPDFILVDAVRIPQTTIPQLPLVKGDGLSASIAAASILAKVTRDRLMKKYDREYPQYGFANHKGYGSKEHIEAICKYGPCPIHRTTFNLKP